MREQGSRMWSPSGGRRRLASVQKVLPLAGIAGDVVCLRGGGYRGVLEARGVNFALKPEPEQEAILASFRRFLNGLDHPLQVLVRVVPADVEGYLSGLDEPGRGTETLRRLRRDHEAFVRRIAHERTLLDRRFHVIVPADGEDARGRGGPDWRDLVLPWRRPQAAERDGGLARARRALDFRCGEVERGLASFGVGSRRLAGEELEALWRAAASGGPAGAGVADDATPVAIHSAHGREAAGA